MKRRTISILLAFLIIFTPLLTGFSNQETREVADPEKHKMMIDRGDEIAEGERSIDEQRLTHLRKALKEQGEEQNALDRDLKRQAGDLQESIDGNTTTQGEKSYRNIEMLKDTLTGAQEQQIELLDYVTIYEEEPNDRFDQANPIKLKSAVVGSITDTPYDVDRFKFTVEVSGIFETSGFWIGDFYELGWEDDMLFAISKAGKETEYIAYSQYYHFSDGSGMQYLEVFLEKGDYYITLLASDEYDDLYVWEPYVLFTDFFPDEASQNPGEPIEGELPVFYEQEPNDWISQANKIIPDTSVIGWIDDVHYDIDYFEIELDRSGYLSIAGIWAGDYLDWGWEDDLYIAIVNEADEMIYAADLYWFDDGTAMVYMEEEVKAGTYYIVVFASQDYGDLYVGEPYIFNVYFEGFEDAHRIAGDNRYLTAYEIAKFNDPNPDTVIIVRGDSAEGIPQVVDGLTASGLAGVMNAQILMVSPNRIPNSTWEALDSLAPKNAIIVGGEAAVGAGVQQALENYGLAVSRVSGDNRYDTGAQVGLAMGAARDNTAIIVNGHAVVDSLVAGALAHKGYPILMVNNARGRIPAETQAAMKALNIEKVWIVGGTGVVSKDIEDQLNALPGVTVDARFGGNTRVETSLSLAGHPVFNEGRQVTIVNGWSYVDAVAASTLGAPVIYYRERSGITQELEAYLTKKDGFKVIGGEQVVSGEIYRSLEDLMQ